MLRRFHPLPLLLVLVGLAASLYTMYARHRAEGKSRAVSLVLDYGQLRTLAAADGTPVPVALERFRKAGITGVAITEETLADLQASGLLSVEAVPTATGREFRLRVADPGTAARLARYLPRLARAATDSAPPGERVALAQPDGTALYFPGRWDDYRLVPSGLDAAEVRQVRDAGLEPIGRINNPLSLTAESLRWYLGQVKAMRIRTVIFAGEEVLGWRGLVTETAQAFIDLDLLYGSVEFGKQRGDEKLSELLQERLLRVHSIASGEMPRMTPGEAVERYVRASAERNIRLCYVRLPGNVSERTFEDSVSYVNAIAQGTVAEHFGLASARPLGEVWESPLAGKAARALVALGVAAGTVLLLAGVFPIRRGLQAILAAGGGVLAAGLAFSGITLGVQLLALAAAIVFPTLALVLFPQPVGAFAEEGHPGVRFRNSSVLPAVLEFIPMSVVTLCGALMVAALLSQLPFMIKVKSFAGIKVSTVIPILIVGFIYLTGMSGDYRTWRAEKEAMSRRLHAFLSEPLVIWHTVAGLIGLVTLALLVARSGNDPGIGVSDTELRFRALLDRLLGVRPRTKEFLLGHPALLLSLAMATVPRWRGWALPLLLVGVIGQTGMLNSFCHLHTPIKMTVLRTFHGMWSGALIGVLLIVAWQFAVSRARGRTPGRSPGRGSPRRDPDVE